MNLKVSVRLNRNSECVEGETRLQSVKTAGSCRGSAVSRHLVCEEVEETWLPFTLKALQKTEDKGVEDEEVGRFN